MIWARHKPETQEAKGPMSFHHPFGLAVSLDVSQTDIAHRIQKSQPSLKVRLSWKMLGQSSILFPHLYSAHSPFIPINLYLHLFYFQPMVIFFQKESTGGFYVPETDCGWSLHVLVPWTWLNIRNVLGCLGPIPCYYVRISMMGSGIRVIFSVLDNTIVPVVLHFH